MDVVADTGGAQPLTVAAALATAAAQLRQAGIDSERLEAEVLLARALATSRTGVFARLADPLPGGARDRFAAFLARRARREPLAHIVGGREFWSLWFAVSRDTLIPRPETERLVELALADTRDVAAPRVLDIGTGTGCIAIAFARERPDAMVTAVDISTAALQLARANAERLGVGGRIAFAGLDIATAPLPRAFDLVLSNPPYVRRDDLSRLPPEVSEWEPRVALDGGPSGVDVIEVILRRGREWLRPQGRLLIEIGCDQAAAVLDLARRQGFGTAAVDTDYAGRQRVLRAQCGDPRPPAEA